MATVSEENNLMQRVEEALAEIRPFLEEDGGDLEVLEITEDLVARVELKGACSHCSMNTMTFKNGVEQAILKHVPEIKQVEAVNFA